MRTRPTWHEYFMLMAKTAATRSTCISRPVGAVIVKDKRLISVGYCGSMEGDINCLDEGECFRRSLGVEDKDKLGFCLSSHAEANAIANAARNGVGTTKGASIYTTLSPCLNCFKLIVNAGIREVYYELGYASKDPFRDKIWNEAIKRTGVLFEKVEVTYRVTMSLRDFVEEITSVRRIESE